MTNSAPPLQDDPTPGPRRSHLSLFCEVQELARHIVDLTAAVPMECQPHATVNRKCYAAIAYRWGHSNEHQYLVYVGTDQVKAVTLAEEEPAYRGGKYGCAVYEFDVMGRGDEGELIFYSPSMAEDRDAHQPEHNDRLDYYESLGMFIDTAYEGRVWLPKADGSNELEITTVELPGFLREEVARMRATLKIRIEAHGKAVQNARQST